MTAPVRETGSLSFQGAVNLVKKPDNHWDSGLHHALRDEGALPAHGQDARAECFDLHFNDGHLGRAEFCLDQQRVDAQSLAKDPELRIAVKAWLLARGQRSWDLRTLGGQALEAGAIAPQDLDLLSGASGERVVSLAPSNFDLLEALGAADRRLIACENSTQLPSTVSAERLGPDLNPDLDRAQALGATLCLASLSVPGMERVLIGLRRRKLAHLVFAPRGLSEIRDDIARLGRAMAQDSRRVIAEFDRACAELSREARKLTRPVRVFLQWWPRPQFSPGADCYSNELIELAGGQNIFFERPGSSLEVSAQEVVDHAPELAFVSWCGVHVDKLDPERLKSHAQYEQLEMVREDRVYPLDEAHSGRPGPKVLLAAQTMAAHIQRYARAAGLRRRDEPS